MKSVISLKFTLLLSSLLLTPLSDALFGCSGGDEYDIIDISIFSPEIIKRPQEEPYFLCSSDYYYGNNNNYPPEISELNDVEWQKELVQVKGAEISGWLVSMSTIQQLDSVVQFYQKKSIDTSNTNIPKEAFQLSNIKHFTAITEYLKIAKRFEKNIMAQQEYWLNNKPDTLELKKLTSLCKKKYSSEKNRFLKNRYGFQYIRGLYLTGKYEQCTTAYEQSIKMAKEDGSMYYRTLGYQSAALYKLKNYSQSNYIYSIIYDQLPEMKMNAFRGFHVQEETDWLACLSLAKNNHEKEVLWQLFGVYADPLRGMKEIYSLNASSEYMELLLVRAINLAETISLEYSSNENYTEYAGYYSSADNGFSTRSWASIDSANLNSLKEFTVTAAKNKQIHQPYVWKTCAAFLCMLNHDYNNCKYWLKQSESDPGCDSLMHGQNAITELISYARQLNSIGPKEEKEIDHLIRNVYSFHDNNLRTERAISQLMYKLSTIYKSNGNLQRAELCFSNTGDYFNDETVDSLIQFTERKNHTPFEKLLLGRYRLNLADLYNELAVQKIYVYDFDAALANFKRNENAGNTELYANPFTIHITDCHDCDFSTEQKTKYTKLSFVHKMIELKNKADSIKDPEEKAQNYFLFANGLYNMTWYGNSRVIITSAVRYLDGESNRFSYSKPESTGPFYDCAEAMKYYEMAMNLTINKELKVKYAWMAAKCEHNIWLEKYYSPDGKDDFEAGDYFKLIKDQFSETKYYSEIINQCGYFCTYLSPGDERCIRNK